MNRKEIVRNKLYVKYLISRKTNEFDMYKNTKQKIVVALAADYGNLGDVAITYAQTKYLKAQYPEAEVIDFPISKTFIGMKSLKSIMNPNDIITIVGGGNTTDMYDDIEFCRQFIIQQFPKNKIVSFPQTICFSESEYGKKAFKRAVNVYSRHNDLTLSAREKKSYDTYKEYFKKNKIEFCPDIVLSLDKSDSSTTRESITLCLRSDKEKRISDDVQNEIIDVLKKKYKIKYQDTHINKNHMSVRVREEELEKIWNDFKKSKLVITDRLHGMIFCAITKTPCIAIDNSTRKVSGVYNKWLKDFSMIKLAEDLSSEYLIGLIENLMTVKLNSGRAYFDEYSNLVK